MRIRLDDGIPRLDLTDPELRLTPEQAEAVAHRGERVLTAGAGAGKTHTLSLRYTSLLLDLAHRGISDPAAVLVLTFTDKAAEEMALRCQTRLSALVRAAQVVQAPLDAADPETAAGTALTTHLTAMSDRFHRARIGTFHGFCASILREFPGQTRTPPGAQILKDAEARQLRRRVLEESLHDLVDQDPGALAPLLDTFGSRHQLLAAGEIAMERRGVLGGILRAHRTGIVSIDRDLSHAAVRPEDAADWIGTVGLPTLHAIRRLVAPSGGGPFVANVLIPTLAAVTAPEAGTDPLTVYATYRQILEALLTPTGQRRSLRHHTVLGLQRDWPGTRYAIARQAMGALEERLGDWVDRAGTARGLPTHADVALYAALTPFAAWVRQAVDRFDATLDAQRLLTFDALESRGVRTVLDDVTVRQALRERHRYVMVDEFQDTDEVQWSLVLALGRDRPDVPEDRLFLVGDVKQAIYGFRGGDVTVFQRAAAQLGGLPAVLPDNFRSRVELIEWFNHVFPNILDSWEPARPGRTGAGGSVSLLRGAVRDLGPDWQSRAVAQLLASEILTPDAPWHDRDRYPVPPIAILLRTRTGQQAFESELRRFGVPFIVAQGVGFWRRPEIIDVVNAFAAVVHGDPTSLVASLRGPWLALLDQDLQDLHQERWAGGSLHRFGADPLQGSPPDRIVTAHARFRRWRADRRRLSAPALLSGIAADLAPSRAVLTNALQAEANVGRLASLVSAHDGDTTSVADWLVGEIEAAPRESEATLQPAAARVVISTVHSAKGLEFEVVIVPELDARPRTPPIPLVVGRLGSTWRIAARAIDPTADLQTRVHPGLFTSLQRVGRIEEDAEARRLLYVAVTRAREHLVLVGEASPPPIPGGRPTWMQLIEEELPPWTVRREAGPLLDVPAPAPPPGPPTPPPDPEIADRIVPLPRAAIPTIDPRTADRFVRCPAQWFLHDVLVAPSPHRPGPVVAARLACLTGILDDGAGSDPDRIDTRWRSMATRVGADAEAREQGRVDLHREVAAAMAHPHLRRALDAPGHAGLRVSFPYGAGRVSSVVDHVWLDATGWVVLGYRSTDEHDDDPRSPEDRWGPGLMAQAWALDPVLREHTRVGIVRGEIYLAEAAAVAPLGPWPPGALDGVASRIDEMIEVATRPWPQTEAAAIDGDVERPCASCGYRSHGCRGRGESAATPSEARQMRVVVDDT